nr:unnamed protein product [Callosobruchus analis]
MFLTSLQHNGRRNRVEELLNKCDVPEFILMFCTRCNCRKISNEIASEVFYVLEKFDEEVERRRLVDGGCGGQNKNSTMVGVVQYWLQFCSPAHIKCVHPVVGYPFLPCVCSISKKAKNALQSLIQKHTFTLLEIIPQCLVKVVQHSIGAVRFKKYLSFLSFGIFASNQLKD